MTVRIVTDWRDLPAVPRIGTQKLKDHKSETSNASPVACKIENFQKRGSHAQTRIENQESDSEEDIFIPRKRARSSVDCEQRAVARGNCEEHLFGDKQVCQQRFSKPCLTRIVKSEGIPTTRDGGNSSQSERATALETEGDDNSDEEAVLRVIRRQRKRVRVPRSANQERKAYPRSKIHFSHHSEQEDAQDRFISARKRTGELKKRKRSSSPTRDQDEGREILKRRRQSTYDDLKRGNKFEEPAVAKPLPRRERVRTQGRSGTNNSRRRRCARRSVEHAGVPWYMLDEERQPFKLRSSSRNCAARCVYWTRTEERLFRIAKSRIHSRGLYAREDIPAFAPVIEYAGEVITQVQSEIREWAYQKRHMDEVYMYQLRKGTTDVIDGTLRGGPAKFVNHSCEPNVVADEIKAGGTNRVWFFSLRPIRKHEEILVDYCLSYEPGDVKRPCKCRAPTCRKVLNYYGLVE